MKQDQRLQIVPPDKTKHLTGIAELMGLAFGENDPAAWRDRIGALLEADRLHYSWRDSRVGLLDGRVVTHVGVVRYRMRLGPGQVLTAGVSAVATHPYCRGRGFMARTFSETLSGFAGAGYGLSLLFGIDNFYSRFGYCRAWNETEIAVRLQDLPAEEPAPPRREYPEVPWSLVNPLYNLWAATIPGTSVRDDRLSPPAFMEGMVTFVWDDSAGKTDGYVMVTAGECDLRVLEFAGPPATVLAEVREIARAWRRRRIVFADLSLAAPLARRLLQGACELRIRPRADGGPMVRTVRLRPCLEALAPDLEARLAEAPTALRRAGGLVLSDGREEIGVRLDNAGLRVTEPFSTEHRLNAGDRLATLLLGGEPPEDVLARPGVEAGSPVAAALARLLFPERFPMLVKADRF